jgi:ABC-2 type transport system ATP-binding protein
MGIIEFEGLQKSYRISRSKRVMAVNGLDLEIPDGGVFGLLGPNGAGKTTIMRCLLGLVRPAGGTMRMLGVRVPDHLHSVIGDVGALVEATGFHPRFSGRRNLELLAYIAGVSPQRVATSLERVGLADRGRDRVATYSLGMRQRLGLAAALLKDPTVLLLDEPTNGLDPAGIADVRDLMRRLAAEGRTVLVSSHLLSEVSQVCDRIAVLANGTCISNGTLKELLDSHAPRRLLVRINDLGSAAAVLAGAGFVVSEADGRLCVEASPDEAPLVGKCLAARNLFPLEIHAASADLESIFLELTGREEGVR